MSAGKSYMRLKSCEKKTKLFVTLGQTQSLAEDLKKQQSQMDYMFENQSTTNFSTDNNESRKNSFCSTLNQSQGTPIPNMSKTSTNYFQKPNTFNNQNNNSYRINTIPQETTNSPINESQNPTHLNTNVTFNRPKFVLNANTINRTNPIQPNYTSRLTHTLQNNPLSQQVPNQYPNQPPILKTNQNLQPIKLIKQPIQQINNSTRLNSTYIDTMQIKQINNQLQQKVTQLQNQLKSQKQKNYRLQLKSQSNSNQINILKTKLNQLQQKSHLIGGSHNVFEKGNIFLQNQHLQFQLTNQKNKIKNLQKIIQQKNQQKQKIIREKQYQLRKKMDQMQMNIQLNNKQRNQKAQQIKNLSDMINIQQRKSNQLEEKIKTIKQKCQQQNIIKFQSEIFRLQNEVGHLQKQIHKRDQQKQGFAKQIQIKLENYMKSTYK